MVAPVIGNFLLNLPGDAQMDKIFKLLSKVIDTIFSSYISKCPGSPDMYLPPEDAPVDFFPSLPKLHENISYKKSLQNLVTLGRNPMVTRGYYLGFLPYFSSHQWLSLVY